VLADGVPLCRVSDCGTFIHLVHSRVCLYCKLGVMSTMRLDLSLCDMWYCEALVLLVGVFFLQCRVLALSRAYCVICTMYVAACSVRVLVYCALLYVATACWLRPCWETFIGGPKLGWVIVILSVGRGKCSQHLTGTLAHKT